MPHATLPLWQDATDAQKLDIRVIGTGPLAKVEILKDCEVVRTFTPKQADSLRRHWLACARRKTSLLISPTVLDVVGRKRSA